jgi:hypothetical protein
MISLALTHDPGTRVTIVGIVFLAIIGGVVGFLILYCLAGLLGFMVTEAPYVIWTILLGALVSLVLGFVISNDPMMFIGGGILFVAFLITGLAS